MKRAPGEVAEAAVEDPMNRALGEAAEAVEAVVDDPLRRTSGVVAVAGVEDPMKHAPVEAAAAAEVEVEPLMERETYDAWFGWSVGSEAFAAFGARGDGRCGASLHGPQSDTDATLRK